MRDNLFIPAGSCWFFTPAMGLLPTGTTSARCCHSPNCELGTKILVVLLFWQSVALDVIPFPKHRLEFGVGRSCDGASQLIRGKKSPNAVSQQCHRLTEAGASQTHRHIVLESAISFPFSPLIPLRKGRGKAPLQNKLVSQKRGSSADGSLVLHTLVQLWSTWFPILNLPIVQMFSYSKHLEEGRWSHLHFPQKAAAN